MQSSEQVEEKLAGKERCKEVVDEFMVRVSFTSWSYFAKITLLLSSRWMEC